MKLKWLEPKKKKFVSNPHAYPNLRKAMIDKKIPDIKALATALGWKYDALYRKLTKSRRLYHDESVEIAKFFGKTVDELFKEK